MIHIGRFSATLLLLLLVAAVCSCSVAMAATYYVAPGGTGDGSIGSPWGLQTANANLQAGDTAILRGGTYNNTDIPGGGAAVNPANSGSSGSPITYQAYPGETPVFARTGETKSDAIRISGKSYITVDGVSAGGDFISNWIETSNEPSHLTIKNCTFDVQPTGDWISARLVFMGDYLVLEGNTFANGGDSVDVQGGNYHLIKNNTFGNASHTCLVLFGVKHSVITGNYFHNETQKCMEVFTTRDTADPAWGLPARTTEYIVIENNEFALAGSNADPKEGEASIQYAGNNSIVRRNIMHDCGIGIDVTDYTDDSSEAKYNEHNRFYHNTFYDNGTDPNITDDVTGCLFSGGGLAWGDQDFTNNIWYANETHTEWADEQMPVSVQICLHPGMSGWTSDEQVFNNCIFYSQVGDDLFGDRWDSPAQSWLSWTLSEFETAYPTSAWDNMDANPLMEDPANGDFTLQSGSPCIDAGVALAYTTSSGSGTVIPVDDALYFSDGKGIVDPDVIRVGGQQATIVYVDYANDEIEVSASLSWANDDPVTLDYDGDGPDMGAYEYPSGPQTPVAEFSGNPTTGPSPLTVDFTDLSAYIPTSWSWDFGDTGTSSAQHPSHQYTTEDIYTVSLTAYNAQGQDTETKTDYITVSNHSCHVGAIDMADAQEKNYQAQATITVHDQNCAALVGVTVDIIWSGATSGSDSDVTDGNGQVVFISDRNKDGGTYTCCVDNLTKTGYPYTSGANHETCDNITLP